MIKWHGDKVKSDFEALADKRLDVLCEKIVTDIKRDMGRPKTGKPGRQTTASREGESPAVQTGHLRRSLTHYRVDKGKQRLGTGVEYGLYLELGTNKMKARPWLRPALQRAAISFRQLWGGKQ